MQGPDRMSVAIHPSETRPPEGRASARSRLPVLVGAAGGGAALLVFAVGAFSFFSDLADPRSRPARIAPVASQWPDLKDGVPALAPFSTGSAPDLRRASLPAAEPTPQPSAAAPVLASSVLAAAPEAAPPPARASLPIEPAATVPPAARTAATVVPTKVAVPLPPSRSETVRAKTEQPARFVSLPAPKTKPEAARTESPKPEIAKAATAKVEAKAEAAKADPARKPAPALRSRAAEASPTQTTSAQAPAARPAPEDEPELLGVKIPGGRQIRDGWDAAVNGLLGGKSGGE